MSTRPVIAVTGASGYVGGLIANALAPEADIVRLLRHPRREGDVTWSFKSGAVPIAEALRARGVTQLVHAAWDMRETQLPKLQESCVAGSQRLLAAAARAGISRVVFISTISAFPAARSAYGRAKLQVEADMRAAGATVLRPGLVYGAGEGGMLGNLTRVVRKARLVPLIGDGSAPQYLLDEATLVSAVKRALAGAFSGETGPITLANPTPVPFRALLERVAAAQGRQPKLVPVPWQVFYTGLWGAERLGLKLGFRSDSILSFIFQNPAPDFSAMERLGITPANLR